LRQRRRRRLEIFAGIFIASLEVVYRSDAVAERLGMAYGVGGEFFGVCDGGERRLAACE